MSYAEREIRPVDGQVTGRTVPSIRVTSRGDVRAPDRMDREVEIDLGSFDDVEEIEFTLKDAVDAVRQINVGIDLVAGVIGEFIDGGGDGGGGDGGGDGGGGDGGGGGDTIIIIEGDCNACTL